MSLRGAIKLIVFIALIASVFVFWPWLQVKQPPGVLVQGMPSQKEIAPRPLPNVEGWKLTAVAEYKLHARILGTKTYHSGVQSSLVPTDVAVGWGKMSDSAVLDHLSLSMGNRFFFYEWSNTPPISQDEIKISAANNHVIAANDEVRSAVRWLRVGQIVTMKGYLVNATKQDGFNWSSSLRRDDTGNGACELFYVESVKLANSVMKEE